jgi:16S rRNA (adenine1518-N6/adenine1519-N6)-dimethyltransferase
LLLTPAEIIKKYNLGTNKSLGQNFLTNPELLDKIVGRCDAVNGKNILEIGTGPCGLTMAILKKNPKKLVTVDMDGRFIDIAKKEFSNYNNLLPLETNAMDIDENELFNGEKFSIISNLPYNVGTPLLFRWLDNYYNKIEQMVLLLQKEVVDRIIAPKNTKEYGKMSVLCQYLCLVEKCFDVQNTAFFPPPKVTSSVVKLTLKQNVDFSLIKPLSTLLFKSFSKRRKTLYNNLKGTFGENVINDFLDGIGMNKNCRAENLTVDDFVKLAMVMVGSV